MQRQLKRYAITIRGRIHHLGYRGLIDGTARKMELKGYAFNDTDNSIKIVCEGLQSSVSNFITTLKDFARSDIESIEKKEIRGSFPLPNTFSRIATDEYYDFNRKFDIGLDYLDGIKTDTGEMKGTLGDIRGILEDANSGTGEMKDNLGSIDEALEALEAFVAEQRGYNKRIDEHNKRLEKILEKLLERPGVL